MTTPLRAINSFRNIEGLEPLAKWHKRAEPVLEQYEHDYSTASENLIADLEEFVSDDETKGRIIGDETNWIIGDEIITEDVDRVPAIKLVSDDGHEISEEEFVAKQEATAAEEEARKLMTATTLPAYKVVANAHGHGHSKIENPVAFVHGFLDANPGLTRKQAVVTLVQVHGVNYSTARTQFQKWFVKNR